MNLKPFCAQVRIDILKMLEQAGQGHLGGSMSIVELLAVLYQHHLHIDPSNPTMEDRDRVVLSKGHAGPAWYATLAEMGYFPRKNLLTLNASHTHLPSHPDRLKTPGVDMTTGSLGQGVSSAAGIGLGLRMKHSNRHVYVIVGDGELNEGQCWEAFQFIAAHQLHECIVIIDDNKRQLDGYTKDVMNPFSIEAKMKAFGFETRKVKGDDLDGIDEALTWAQQQNQAVAIILDSIKGQGLARYEAMKDNHSVKFNDELKALNAHYIEQLERIVKGEELCLD